MITLGGVDLTLWTSEIIWDDRYVAIGVQQEQTRTLGGRLILSCGPLIGGRPITLRASENFGWLSKAKALQLIGMANTVGAAYTFVFDDLTQQVSFDFSRGPAVRMRPLADARANDDDDWFIGELLLITV